MRSLGIAVIVGTVLVTAAAFVGGVLSLFTGKATDLPQWNGWPYFFFCAREGAIFGAIVALPIAGVAFILLAFRSSGGD
jgi:hypothetical protein